MSLLIKFWNFHNFVTILNFLLGFGHSISLITGFSINRSLKKFFMKVHKTFKYNCIKYLQAVSFKKLSKE